MGLLQTAYVHLFGWLTRINGGEIVQITVARLIYVVIWGGSLALLYRLARRLLDPLGALASVVLFALFSYSVTHAASFRIDGLLLPVLLATTLLLLHPTMAQFAAAGALFGLALALTIKAVLWVPALAGLLALHLWGERSRLKPLLVGAAAAVGTFGAVMLLHHRLITDGASETSRLAGIPLSRVGFYMLRGDGLLPRADVLRHALLENPATWTLIIFGACLTGLGDRAVRSRRRDLAFAMLALPIVSVVFYANAWPYAYLVLIPTTCLLAGRSLSYLVDRRRPLGFVLALSSVALASVPLAGSIWRGRVDEREHQKQILSIVHERFPEPVPYIDRTGMVSSFPRPIFYLTRFGLRSYRELGQPVLSEYIKTVHPPFLIINTPTLDPWDGGGAERLEPNVRLLPEDEETIRATYARYWGQLYLAGRQWLGVSPDERLSFEIVIPGEYTLLSEQPVMIDGVVHGGGTTLRLAAGAHEVRTTSAERDLRLLWGRDTRIPVQEVSGLPIFFGL